MPNLIQTLVDAGVTSTMHEGRRDILRTQNAMMMMTIGALLLESIAYVSIVDHPVAVFGVAGFAVATLGPCLGLLMHWSGRFLGYSVFALLLWTGLLANAVVHGVSSGFMFWVVAAPATGSITVPSRWMSIAGAIFVGLGCVAGLWSGFGSMQPLVGPPLDESTLRALLTFNTLFLFLWLVNANWVVAVRLPGPVNESGTPQSQV